jgi:hypothetical protein
MHIFLYLQSLLDNPFLAHIRPNSGEAEMARRFAHEHLVPHERGSMHAHI